MNPIYQQTTFLTSAPELRFAPEDSGSECAFAGRSNAGKSSAINLLTSQKNLAKTSRTPGRTQQLVFFNVDSNRRIVDLPGYGYAKVSAATQRRWQITLENYMQQRRSLRGVFLVADIRHALTEFDRQLIEWCNHCQLPVHIALTKSDKLSRGAAKSTLIKIRTSLQTHDAAPSVQLFSATKRLGIDEAHDVLDRWLALPD